ncbi:MAG: hypothetical protein QF511_06430 [Rhodospirillales bacterium]|jgi:hypothetical protein|nr:hypothetical protein [Rhodospirillales bacterium]HIJ42671.1 hypothetical protein [Rhodospirillaceae bacterium]MDP7098140.1 hypothetical protein [Rhodospirillales bacterium]MDP7214483.1 hypothetical protein [Rhodospirillales bacterium]HIJ45849.1 hypothetical protein [Rhodospirillaceae bacterium]
MKTFPAIKPPLITALALVVTAIILGGCYMPVRFDAEIEITRYGFYNIIFNGYLVSIPLYDGLRKGKISAGEEKIKAANLKTDLTRDSAVKEFQYVKQGHFKVHWEKKGDLLRTKMVTFLRRNANIISLKYVRTTGRITMTGTAVAPSQAKRLSAMGLNITGELRLKTDANVVDHNATKVKKTKKHSKLYIWKLKSIFDPSPNLVISVR